MHDRLKVTFRLDLKRGALQSSRIVTYTLDQFSGGRSLTALGEVNGNRFPAGTTVYVPSIWVRDAADLNVQ
jgi:hypothetical protein